METQLDKTHYSSASIDGFNAWVNFIVSLRGPGKTTAVICKIWTAFYYEGKPSFVQRRLQADITEIYIESLHDTFAKFFPIGPFRYNKASMKKDGMVDVFLDKRLFLRIIAIGSPLNRLKGLFLKDAAIYFADEFIVDTRLGERYVPREAWKFRELWTTFWRESPNLKAYFCGNLYSLYNPYFSEFGVPVAQLKKGVILAGPKPLLEGRRYLWACERYEAGPELLALLKKNPMVSFEDEYTRYALGGEAVNDDNIWIDPNKPNGWRLLFFFKEEGKYMGVWKNPDPTAEMAFWIGFEETVGKSKGVYCFDFKDLSERAVLFSRDEKNRFEHLRMALRKRAVAFGSLECDYLMEEIYKTL